MNPTLLVVSLLLATLFIEHPITMDASGSTGTVANAQVNPQTDDPVLVGAGDIAKCPEGRAEATARLLDEIPGTVFTLGDNAYTVGSPEEFANCYHPSWGRHKHRTFPSVGNHEYLTAA
jgi:acid phosphatase type 7